MNPSWHSLAEQVSKGNFHPLARALTFVENAIGDYQHLMLSLDQNSGSRIIGITGPPGAGKSTLTDVLIGEIVKAGKKVAILCVDPSSPFNMGALLGDRIRMSEWYTNPNVFIRSLATRGSLGGLHPKIIEISEVLKAAAFDFIIVETVGVGQSEVEIAGLADATIVVLVPESGDEIQVMKAGLMEIADLFVVNKSDRPGADLFIKNLQARTGLSRGRAEPIPVLKTVASQKEGIADLYKAVLHHLQHSHTSEKKYQLLAQRVFHIIRDKRMKDIDMEKLVGEIRLACEENRFNLYKLVSEYQ